MSEQLPVKHELPAPEGTGTHEKHPVKSKENVPKALDSIQEIQKSIEQHATSIKEHAIDTNEPNGARPTVIDRALKQQTYRHTMDKIRTSLTKPQQMLSKVVHQPVIEAASEVGSKTVARPSGILGGGIAALIGSGIIYYLSRKYGYSYNHFVFILLYSAGFIVGMVVELSVYSFRKARRGR